MLSFEEIERLTAEEGKLLNEKFGDELSFLILKRRNDLPSGSDVENTIYGRELFSFLQNYYEFSIGGIDFLSKEQVNKYNFSKDIPWFDDKKCQENMILFAISDPFYFTIDIFSGEIFKNTPGLESKEKIANSFNDFFEMTATIALDSGSIAIDPERFRNCGQNFWESMIKNKSA